MSLIRTRRRRKKNWLDSRRGLPRNKLVGLLFVTVIVIWYLGWRF